MDLKNYIETHFNLNVITVNSTANGSGNTYDVITRTGRYIVKLGERSDFLSVYRKVQPFLDKAGLVQSRIAYSDEKLILYEWLNGETPKELTPTRVERAILYMKRYFEVLKNIPLNEIKIRKTNTWDDAKSLSFLLKEFPKTVHYQKYPSIVAGIERLSKVQELLEMLPKQLVHSDLGADNFLFIGDEVNAIIDFTPEIAPDLYGLCQFLYWNVLWKENNLSSLHRWANLYSNYIDYEVFDLLMIQAALYRVVGPLLNGYANLDKRLMLLDSLL